MTDGQPASLIAGALTPWGPGNRPFYDRASAALDAAHKACFGHPDRDIALGMSHGPFSGVNEALGIIATLEGENQQLRAALADVLAKRKP